MTSSELDIRTFFDEIAADGVMQDFTPAELTMLGTLLERWRIGPGQSVMEVGCGSGRLSEILAKRLGPWGRLLALDISLGMLRRARIRIPSGGTILSAASAHRLPVRDSCIDTILWFQVFPHLSDPEKATREAARVLVPGGTLWISHLTSRREVNRLHASLDPRIHDHMIPDDRQVRSLIGSSGLRVLDLEDSSFGYLVRSEKRPE